MEARSVTVYAGPVERGNRGGPGSDPNQELRCLSAARRSRGVLFPASGSRVIAMCRMAGREQIMRSYEVAYGSARWRPYQGGVYGLAQTGSNADGSPLYSCRVRYSPNPEPITATSPASWSPTGRVISRWVEAKSCRARRLMCSMLPVADGRRILIHPIPILRIPTLILTRCRQCSRRNHIHRAGKAIRW